MNRICILVSVLAMSFCARASYLYWQVTSAPTGFESANYARLVHYSTTTYGSGTMTDISGWESIAMTETLSVDVGAGYDGAYFIELGNYDEATMTVLGHTNDNGTYSGLSSYIASSLSEITATAAWSGTSYSVPEPTSGMMMMVALALLGLRRKQVA